MQITALTTSLRPKPAPAPWERFEDHFAADITAPGLPSECFIQTDRIEGDRRGYAGLDDAIAAATTLSAGEKQAPAVVFQADDQRFYVFDSLGGHMINKHTAEEIDLGPVLENAPAGSRATLTPRSGGAVDGSRLRAVVDGAQQWRFSGAMSA